MCKFIRVLFIGYFCFFLLVCGFTRAYADPALDEVKQLLQKSLTIVQIDQEIARLNGQEQTISEQIKQSNEDIAKQDVRVAETRERAGKVLRAYYMGDRDSLWMLLFSAKSFSDALVVYDYLNMIFKNDRMLLTSYQNSYRELVSFHQKLEQTEAELKAVKNEFIAQRERVVALQKEVEEQIQQQPPEAIPVLRAQIEEVKNTYNDKILPLFQSYFKGISVSMQSLPELLNGPDGSKYLKGTVFQISDGDLTAFLRSKNSQLPELSLRFAGGQFAAAGKDGAIPAEIIGHYTVEQNPNRLQFHVDRLTYDGNPLDETTNRSLEKDFDLSFSPEKYVSIFQAESVSTENGLLTIKLKLKLK